jgi:hypothetical protein
LLIDEVGYENYTAEQANLFFQLVNSRYEQGSIMITTHKPFGKWSEILSDDAIATATLDRLLHHAHIISLKGDSCRMEIVYSPPYFKIYIFPFPSEAEQYLLKPSIDKYSLLK